MDANTLLFIAMTRTLVLTMLVPMPLDCVYSLPLIVPIIILAQSIPA